MIKVGLTGGIGSGKTTVANVFNELGIPIFFADIEAKKFLNDSFVIEKLVSVFGHAILFKDEIDRQQLASIVFSDKEALNTLNSIIHPLVRMRFIHWATENSHHPFVIIEAAILFENGFNELVDKTILVVAPLEERIQRASNRDGVSKEKIIERINNQWSQDELVTYVDYIIDNCENSLIIPQILEVFDVIQFLNSSS